MVNEIWRDKGENEKIQAMSGRTEDVDWLVVFYGMSTLEGYLRQNPVYTYILCT